MDSGTRAPDPGPLADFTRSYSDAKYLSRADPLMMLRLGDSTRAALRAYDEACVAAARRGGATWDEIGRATGMARQNAQRKWGHVA
jgi:hypothetical protein